MTTYKLTTWGGVIKDGGAAIPPDTGNQDYRDYLAWVELGNVASPADVPTQAQLDKEAEINAAVGIAKNWLAGQQVAINFIRLTPAQQMSQIDGMNLVQLKEVVKFLAVVVSALTKREFLG